MCLFEIVAMSVKLLFLYLSNFVLVYDQPLMKEIGRTTTFC